MNERFVYGIHAVTQFLKQSPDRCLALYCADRRNPRLLELVEQARTKGVEVRMEKRERLTQLGGGDKHQGCLLEIIDSTTTLNFDQCLQATNANTLLLVLDGVQDPHNLGACLRTADAVGVRAVILPKDRAVGLNETVRKVACGAAENTPVIHVTNLSRALREMQETGIWVIGTADDAENTIYEEDLTSSIALVMGSEGQGLRQNTRKHCDKLVNIPMAGVVESLNVSVAAGVCLYEARRQRHLNK